MLKNERIGVELLLYVRYYFEKLLLQTVLEIPQKFVYEKRGLPFWRMEMRKLGGPRCWP